MAERGGWTREAGHRRTWRPVASYRISRGTGKRTRRPREPCSRSDSPRHSRSDSPGNAGRGATRRVNSRDRGVDNSAAASDARTGNRSSLYPGYSVDPRKAVARRMHEVVRNESAPERPVKIAQNKEPREPGGRIPERIRNKRVKIVVIGRRGVIGDGRRSLLRVVA